MQIIPVKYGDSVLSESAIFKGGDESKARPITFKVYLIKNGEKLILVDAGCETMPGFDMKNFSGTPRALRDININPCDITDVIITHAHHDHIECVKYFDNAVIHIEENELKEARQYIPDGFKLNVFRNEFPICENVRIIKVGGHSRGSCIVEIKKENTTYIIAGDECYLRECLKKRIPTGSSCCPERSLEFIEKYSREEYSVLLCHDD